jgi:hypothetical protein
MEVAMKPHIGYVAMAMTLCAGSAHAQTVITQEIEPVAPLIVVTEPLQIIRPVETVGLRQADTVAVLPAARPTAVLARQPAKATRKTSTKTTIVARKSARKPVAVGKPVAVRKTVAVRKAVAVRTPVSRPVGVRQPAAAPVVIREAVSLTPGERAVLYRTIVREQIVPRPVMTERVAPVVREQVAPAAPIVSAPLVTERVLITPPVAELPLVSEQAVTAPIIAGPQPVGPMVTQRMVTAAAPMTVTYTIGSQLPANVPLYAIPESAALQVPVVRRYSYAFINDRVLLVEPATGIVVAELDR